ncbi:MAG: hypothetical protein JNJ54_31610 [Myxococcaceae bacterium]|nr:hypothetical protein [Myxococcaceae bacterium]
MPRPSLTFFNEQDSDALAATFTPAVLTTLSLLKARVAMGLRDLTNLRAEVVRQLNEAGIPVIAWVLLPRDEGYFATHTNAPLVEAAVERLRTWAEKERLSFRGLGLDFEPDLRELERLMAQPARTLARWLFRPGRGRLVLEAQQRYQALVDRLRADGLEVETYQFPFILDDRRRRSHFWQRTLGALALEADREVVMLYTSLMGAAGPGLLAHYARSSRAVAVGSTGGGIDPFPKLSWHELERDLVQAARHAPDVHVFSLEGCVQQGVTDRLLTVEWDRPIAGISRGQRFLSRMIASVSLGLARPG